MPPRANKGKANQPSTSTKKPTPRNAPVKPKNTRKRQASESEDSSDNSSPASEGPSRKRKNRKRKKQVELYDDDRSDIIPEEVEDDEPDRDRGRGANNGPDDEVMIIYFRTVFENLHSFLKAESGLEDCHIIKAPTEVSVKKDTTKDLLMIFSDIVTVQFKKKIGGATETVKGRWYLPCKSVKSISKEDKCLPETLNRADEKTVKAKGLRKVFFTGSNSSCRQHIRQHYELYKQRCNDEHIPINQRAIPPQVLREMEASRQETKTQSTLDGILTKVSPPAQFSRDGLLEAVAKFVACDNQVSSAWH